MVQKFEEDGSQRDGAPSCVRKRKWDSWICATFLWGKKKMYMTDGLHLSGKGAAIFAEGLSGTVASGLGKVRYLN